MTTEQYLSAVNQRYQLGNATEHTFRGDLNLHFSQKSNTGNFTGWYSIVFDALSGRSIIKE